MSTELYEVDMNPYLYILMRTDLASMNPGKAVAQGAHAVNVFVRECEWTNTRSAVEGFEQWEASTPQNFGVTITLGVNYVQLQAAVRVAKAAGFAASIVTDPTYPLRDGEVTHLIPLETCGYVFGDKEALFPILGHFPLMD